MCVQACVHACTCGSVQGHPGSAGLLTTSTGGGGGEGGDVRMGVSQGDDMCAFQHDCMCMRVCVCVCACKYVCV